jgi:predicted metalloprotease
MAQDKDDDNDKRTPEERAKHRTEAMTKDLGLSAEQTARIYTINLEFARANTEAKGIADETNRKEKKQSLKATRDAGYKTVLTADQYAKLMQQRDQKKDGAKKDDKPKDKKPHNE